MKSATPTFSSTRHPLCNSWEEMSAILAPDHNLVYWPRPQDPAITRFLEALTQLNPVPAAIKGSLLATQVADLIADRLAPYCRGYEDGFDRLCSDVGELATAFSTLANSPRLRMTFAVIEHDMCRLFHTDAIGLRLLCTYVGPGTLWVPDESVNWDQMHTSSNEARVRDMSNIQQFAPFELGILKGAMFEPNNGPAVLHRSPTLSKEDGSKRVLLRFDSQVDW